MAYVIIPAYRPDKKLIEITDELWEAGCRIVVVDDGSGSEFQKIFQSAESTSVVLHHAENRGKGAAIKTALSYIEKNSCGNELIGIMDCDGQHLTRDMIRILEYAACKENELILGVRHVGKEMPLKSRVGNQITRTVFRLVCAREHIPIEEVPIETIYTDKKNSCSHFKGIRDSARIYKDILKFTVSSISSFLMDYFLFTLLAGLLPKTAACILTANVTARIISAMYNYHMNCRFVFQTDGTTKTAAEYFTLAGGILLLNSFVLYGLTHMTGMPVPLRRKQRRSQQPTGKRNSQINLPIQLCLRILPIQAPAPGKLDRDTLIKKGAYQSWIFGPSLLDENGKAKTSFITWDYIRQSHPRTAIGYYEPGHYCLLVVDGRQSSSRGMFLSEMAQVFENLGCKAAYNLDGGHCSFMNFCNKTANNPYKPKHQITDGIFISEAAS